MDDVTIVAEGLAEGTATLLCDALRQHLHIQGVRRVPDARAPGTWIVVMPEPDWTIDAYSQYEREAEMFARGFIAGRQV